MELSTYLESIKRNRTIWKNLISCRWRQLCIVLRGCTAPSRDENQLHAAVVELIALDDAEINQPYKTGIQETKKVKVCITLWPKEGSARKTQKSLDTSRNRFRYHLEIPICILKVTTQLVNFIRLQWLTISASWYWNQNDPFRKTLNQRLFQRNFWRSQNSYRFSNFHQMQITQEIFAMRPC
jgi:hypothetical protein